MPPITKAIPHLSPLSLFSNSIRISPKIIAVPSLVAASSCFMAPRLAHPFAGSEQIPQHARCLRDGRLTPRRLRKAETGWTMDPEGGRSVYAGAPPEFAPHSDHFCPAV